MAQNLVSDDDVEKALGQLRFKAGEAAKARADRIYMEAYAKTVKANVMQQHLELPVSAQEREAYGSKEYKEQLIAMREAIERDEMYRWKMVAAQATIECWRSEGANRRGELKIG